jgi:hypothetical protein
VNVGNEILTEPRFGANRPAFHVAGLARLELPGLVLFFDS